MRRLLRTARSERASFALVAVVRQVFEQLVGRIHARLLGWAGSYLGPGSRVIGSKYISAPSGANINRYAWIEAVHNFRGQEFRPTIQIGHRFSASDRLHISCINRVQIGDGCLFGSSVYVSDHNHGIYTGPVQSTPSEMPVDRTLYSTGPVIIGANVWVGDNVVIVGPVTIGDGVVIGANSVVKRDIPCNVMVGGIPIRILKIYDPTSMRWEINGG